MPSGKVIGHFIWRLIYCQRQRVINYSLYLQKNLRLISRVFEDINKKVRRNFYYLASSLTENVSLGVVNCAIK